MYAGGIQGILPIQNPHKAGALFIGLGAEFGHFQKLLSVSKASIGLPVIHNVSGYGLVDTGYVFQQRYGGGVQVHAHFVHTVFHHPPQGFPQFFLIHVMLILPHADGLRINLHQFRQRVLEPAGNGCGAALAHVKIGKFLRGQLAGRIHGSAGLVDDHILYRAVQFFKQFHNHLLGLPGSRAVAHGDQVHLIFADQAL